MRIVYFVRHAKSSWDNPGLRDFDRPLNNRGLRDAPFMATVLKNKNVKIDRIISSPANRAKTTAGYFARALEVTDFEEDEIIYEAYTDEVLELVKEQPEHINHLMLFGHNPTFTSIANLFSNTYIANLPTCGIVEIELAADNWSDFNEENAIVKNIYFPKQFFK